MFSLHPLLISNRRQARLWAWHKWVRYNIVYLRAANGTGTLVRSPHKIWVLGGSVSEYGYSADIVLEAIEAEALLFWAITTKQPQARSRASTA